MKNLLKWRDMISRYDEAVYWNSDKINLAYWQFAGRKLADYFVKNPTKDEHGNLIDPWEPA